MNPETVIRSSENTVELSFSKIANHWIAEMSRGHVRFEPDQVFTRSVHAEIGGTEFKLIFNAARKNRGQSKAA
jgi:hypothetical protein